MAQAWRAGVEQLETGGDVVLSARPDEAETQMSYAGLADLLDPVLDDGLAELPAPLRQALTAALHRSSPLTIFNGSMDDPLRASPACAGSR